MILVIHLYCLEIILALVTKLSGYVLSINTASLLYLILSYQFEEQWEEKLLTLPFIITCLKVHPTMLLVRSLLWFGARF